MEIRALTVNDASAYWKIRLQALESDPEAFTESADEHRTLTVDQVAARLASDPENNFIMGVFTGDASAGKRLVGTAGFYRNKGIKVRHKGHIWGVYVSREARGLGAGRKMLRALLDRALNLPGLEQIMLAVGTTQEPAAKLYRSLGFESCGHERRALKIGHRYLDEMQMVRFIK
jgi:ribosomal protein S18 acetylase RimI-like enzyme